MTHDQSNQWNDYNLLPTEIAELESFKHVVNLFAKLRYNVDGAQKTDHVALQLDTEGWRQAVRTLHYIGTDPEAEEIQIYLLEVRSVTQKLIQDLARRMRNLPGDHLLVLTKDYEQLNFVLLERVKVERNSTISTVLEPRILVVDRHNPDTVTLRALKRFTFTARYATDQWNKLRNAYAFAEWSEPYFENRALFSDYYLTERLKDDPEWKVRPRDIWEKVYELTAEIGEGDVQETSPDIALHLVGLLGFNYTAHYLTESEQKRPYYRLYTQSDSHQPIALIVPYRWNRNLDIPDPERDDIAGSEIPSTSIVSVLNAEEAPWVILTNGKRWRLYSTSINNKATNYYEVDLLETYYVPDRETAFRYWWLFFRPEAYTGFLDKVLAESADYAKRVSDDLKGVIFDDIVPQFAKGFIADMQAKGMSADEVERALPLVFTSTLTLLYRLMFQLYAESRELLPVRDIDRYGAWSLYRLKNEIARRAGISRDTASAAIRQYYSAESIELYREWLSWLFRLIDKGSSDLNLPTYNGGLFSSSTEEGKFLERYAIPDQYLALGMDKLCRAPDDRTEGLAMIDFKSLGVRQLGSIYEGLLEFKLDIASEELAVIKDKGKEVYLTAREAKKQNKRVLKTVQPGEVHLINDKSERKATGSYYTPDYIVKYIVQHTVGPVLDRKFEELTPRLREAQSAYRKHRANKQATGDDPEKFWNDFGMPQLADDCLSIRVLDPAMGSGHFLVEVVDYVSNRLIDFLNGWSENPVWALLDRTRDDIQAEVARQGVTIEIDRLTPVALLKRAVLKRCIYGVDLNLMAVELAKVSLWLDAFTLGAPLSFLDHHLKWGNSLIGARVGEVQDFLAAREGTSYDMFATGKFAGIMLATDLMRQVSYLSDNTVAQVEESKRAYDSARDHLEPFKRILHIYTSRWFGNEPQKRKGAHDYEPARELLNHPDLEKWLQNPVPESLPEKDYMNSRQVATLVLATAGEKRFFHWELEFPEIYFAPSTPGGQDVQLREAAGFDAVVGNPPYGDVLQTDEKEFLEATSGVQTGGRAEIYANFIVLALNLLGNDGRVAYIVQNTMLDGAQFGEFRRYISGNSIIEGIRDYRNLKVFSEAETLTMIVMLRNSKPSNSIQELITEYWADNEGLLNAPMTITSDSPNPWRVTNPVLERVLNLELSMRLEPDLATCHDAGVDYKYKNVGWQNRGDNPKLSEFLFYSGQRRDNRDYPLIKGADFNRYYIGFENNYVIHDWEKLRSRETTILVYLNLALVPTKILTRQTSDRIQATIDRQQHVTAKSVHTTIISDDLYSPEYVVSVLNSSLIDYVYRTQTGETGRTFAQVKLYDLRPLPIRRIDFTTPADIRASHLSTLTDLNERDQYSDVMPFAQSELDAGRTDVIHDFLAYLAEQMFDLNRRKQAEVNRFLSWLEGALKIKPKSDGSKGIDSLTGKTYIQNYLGDYQKGQPERTWDDFYNDLWKNKNRFNVSLGDLKGQIEAEYAESLDVLLPIKQQLAATDELIDQIVYKLYGLTDEEIELIERPQYEQAINEAKADVLADKELSKPENASAAFDYVAERIEAAAVRLNTLSPSQVAEASLDDVFPAWRSLSKRAQTLLVTAERDYLDETRPDYTGSEINYAKVIEATLKEMLFDAFKQAGYTADDVVNTQAFKPFMSVGKKLTLGNFPFLFSSQEKKFRAYVQSNLYPDADTRIFGAGGIAGLLTMDQINSRNGSAHEDVVTRERAGAAREWALKILRYLC